MKRNDVLLVCALLLAALAAYIATRAGADAGAEARVYAGGECVWVCPMDEDARFDIRGVSVEVAGGVARITGSDCPDRSCVLAGGLTRAGEAAVCLPNAVSLVIEGGGGLDAVLK